MLVGQLWTPNRDAAGKVIASDLSALPTNQWLDIEGSLNDLNDVVQLPHYPKAGAAGGDSAVNIVDAWGGAAWDYINQRMNIGNGGHGDVHECETGIYVVDAATLRFERLVDRQPLSMVQAWDFGTHALVLVSKGNAVNVPLVNGVPSFPHTYDGLVWLPPGTPGAGPVKGGMFLPGNARSVVNLDTGEYAPTHWNSPERVVQDWSYAMCFVDGSSVYRPNGSWFVSQFELDKTEATDWSSISIGKSNYSSIRLTNVPFPYSAQTFCRLREVREVAAIKAGGAVRIRAGEAIDHVVANSFGQKDWAAYMDAVTFTSDDGSHADFSAAAMADDGPLCDAGVHYDHAAACIWYQGCHVGSPLYKITQLDSRTSWKTQKIAGTGARYKAYHGTYGRFAVATLYGVKLALRVSGTTQPLQVMRIDA